MYLSQTARFGVFAAISPLNMSHALLLALLFSLLSITLATASSKPLFICGSSTSAIPDRDTLSLLKSINARYNRVYLAWRYVQKDMILDLNEYLGVGKDNDTPSWRQLRNIFNESPSKLDSWMNAPVRSWTAMDNVVQMSLDLGMDPIVEVGEGTYWCLPELNGEKYSFDPNIIGREVYLSYIYAFSRAVARRYSTQHGVVRNGRLVETYQIENELNEAYYSSLLGWRKFKLFGNIWGDWGFLTELMEMLHAAVHDECSFCATTQNVHADMSAAVHKLTGVRGFYLDAIRDWEKYMDFVSFDSYPNYYVSQPLLPETLGEKVAAIRGVLKELSADDKMVIVMETGYAVSNVTQDLPPSLNFTQEHQYEWVKRVVPSIVEAGGSGLIYFTTVKAPGVMAPPGGYTKQDADAMAMLAKLYGEDVVAAVQWLSDPANWGYLTERLPILAGSIESGWGLLEMDGTPRAGIKALQEACVYGETMMREKAVLRAERR